MSKDKSCFKTKDEQYINALDNSIFLLNNSEIKIIFLYLEKKAEHNINQSAAIEIYELFKERYKGEVILIIEEGVQDQIRANLKGVLAKGKTMNWISIPFNPIDKSHEEMVESACTNYIYRNFLGDK